ncbi:TPM domain-containing protein [Paenibacillus thermotolerans]|uniref:TPM domain-containing protein n=1 Tax=Paenibacillus thermotolerans TaxID=3027807 RepID=UPI002368D3EF|nr:MULTISPECIES: TPM domain-containing protein [unclassified Paenibacillus]
MSRNRWIAAMVLVVATILLSAIPLQAAMAESVAANTKHVVYDDAGLLTREEHDRLEAMAKKYGAERETDIIIFTSSNPGGIDVMKLTQDFYDRQAPGYDKPHGNAVILTLDMNNRELYLAGFYKAELYLDDSRLDNIRDKITPYLTNGDYALAFEKYIRTAYDYMGVRPGVDPDNILFNLWFQLIVAAGIGAIVVGMMAYHSGGRVTVHRGTYEDAARSGIVARRDEYTHTTTTKRKIVKSSGGSGGGGGGRTGGGHSHSGSRGSF